VAAQSILHLGAVGLLGMTTVQGEPELQKVAKRLLWAPM
jgi:hypothetical protein